MPGSQQWKDASDSPTCHKAGRQAVPCIHNHAFSGVHTRHLQPHLDGLSLHMKAGSLEITETPVVKGQGFVVSEHNLS